MLENREMFIKRTDNSMLKELSELQKKLSKSGNKARIQNNRMNEMKDEISKLQKANKEFKEYFEQQNERLNTLRSVNKNLEKKLNGKKD